MAHPALPALAALAAALAAMLLVAGFGIWWFRPTETAIGKPSIAVLPFDNLGGDDATGRLAAGVTEDIITDLSRYRDLDVMARNATAAYNGKAVDIRAVGKAIEGPLRAGRLDPAAAANRFA